MVDQNRGNQNQGGRRNPADNLTREDRVRGGERSAQLQQRDQHGQFAGRTKGAESRSGGMGGNDMNRNRPGR